MCIRDRRRAAAVRRVAVDAAPMGCTMVLHTCADEACCCRVDAVEPGGRAAAAGVAPGDVLLEANGCVPPDDDGASEAALVDFFRGLAYPLSLTFAREADVERPAECTEDAAPPASDHEVPLHTISSSLLYSPRPRVAHAAAAALGFAAALDSLAAVAHARAMDVRTATAVAMTPALVQRLSSWAPDDELLETVDGLPAGLSRDEATFTRPPPAEATYAFPFARRTALILELLELDPALKKAHTKLAHKAKEETFFTNYFYRVAEVRAADPRGDLVLAVAVEGQPAAQHEEQDHAQRPGVDGLRVLSALEELRRDVAERAHRVPQRLRAQQHLRQTEVRDDDVAPAVPHEDVLGLEVAVDDAELVEVGRRVAEGPQHRARRIQMGHHMEFPLLLPYLIIL